jgi:hypothetical protein
MYKRHLIVFTLFALVSAACGASEEKPPTAGEARSFATACDKANEGKRIAVDGYLRLPEEMNRKTGPVLRLYQTGDFSGDPIGVSTKTGDQPNQVAMVPKEYSDKDLKVKTSDGQVAGSATKVRVSGDMYIPTVAQKFPCALSNPLVEMAK